MSLNKLIGYVLLLHAAYSSNEHHALKIGSSLPTDIILEVVIGLMVVNFSTLESLRIPKKLSVVSGGIVENKYQFLKPIAVSKAMMAVNDLGVTEYEYLETRMELMDVVAKREEYLRWANENERAGG